MEPFKNLYTVAFFEQLVRNITAVYSGFDGKKFISLLFDKNWEGRELKDRMRHTTHCLYKTLPEDYDRAVSILEKAAARVRPDFLYMFFPGYVEEYGLDHFDRSVEALANLTSCSSSEFAVRPFIIRYQDEMMAHMLRWADDENYHIRRLSSEGCRPRLPWGIALSAFKKDPAPILPILEKLKDDPTDYVRRSVANNLNDISKDHPDVVLSIANRWKGTSKECDWIIKHACRGLLKQGNTEAMRLFGFGDPAKLHVSELRMSADSYDIGDKGSFSFALNNRDKKELKVRLEYKVYYMKASGKPSPKVFQISEKMVAPGEILHTKQHSFEERTTRKHYPGAHKVAIVVNGLEKAETKFSLN